MSDRERLSEAETNELLNAAYDGDLIAFLSLHDALRGTEPLDGIPEPKSDDVKAFVQKAATEPITADDVTSSEVMHFLNMVFMYVATCGTELAPESFSSRPNSEGFNESALIESIASANERRADLIPEAWGDGADACHAIVRRNPGATEAVGLRCYDDTLDDGSLWDNFVSLASPETTLADGRPLADANLGLVKSVIDEYLSYVCMTTDPD